MIQRHLLGQFANYTKMALEFFTCAHRRIMLKAEFLNDLDSSIRSCNEIDKDEELLCGEDR
jgi:hypothetical protein